MEKLDKLGAVSGDLGLALFKVAKAEEAQVGPRGCNVRVGAALDWVRRGVAAP